MLRTDDKKERVVRCESEKIARLQERVFAFYRDNKRQFPWRETVDRYAVLISEVMLQQTQAERVVGKYLAWMERFPDIPSLVEASLKDVLASWSGLGYNARGQRLHRCAMTILKEHDGVVPSSQGKLIELPGIGAYTSRSIPIFADNLDIATVDTNIRRIFIHELGLPENIRPGELLSLAEEMLPEGRSREWHNALMDYGALHLTGRKTGIRPRNRQSSFKGSKRWYRGRIIKELLAVDMLCLETLIGRYGEPVTQALAELEEEGLVERLAGQASSPCYRIRE
ncbi:MAG: hypothetical protein OQK61_08610 [Ignavibacteriaceae bacterium]|nr:hypothetical protein [Ignavibacteriaceae bacterium]